MAAVWVPIHFIIGAMYKVSGNLICLNAENLQPDTSTSYTFILHDLLSFKHILACLIWSMTNCIVSATLEYRVLLSVWKRKNVSGRSWERNQMLLGNWIKENKFIHLRSNMLFLIFDREAHWNKHGLNKSEKNGWSEIRFFIPTSGTEHNRLTPWWWNPPAYLLRTWIRTKIG